MIHEGHQVAQLLVVILQLPLLEGSLGRVVVMGSSCLELVLEAAQPLEYQFQSTGLAGAALFELSLEIGPRVIGSKELEENPQARDPTEALAEEAPAPKDKPVHQVVPIVLTNDEDDVVEEVNNPFVVEQVDAAHLAHLGQQVYVQVHQNYELVCANLPAVIYAAMVVVRVMAVGL